MTHSLNALTNQDISKLAPAAVARRPDPARSERYAMIQTLPVIEQLRELGYEVTDAQQDNPRRRNPKHVRHLVRLVPSELLKEQAGTLPQLLFWNSHNGRTMARLCAGFYRFVCANGMIVGEETAMYQIMHVGDVRSQIAHAVGKIAETHAQQVQEIERWTKIELSQRKVNRYAERAAELRWGDVAGNYPVNNILEARREQDEGRTLWKVFNRVQENLTRHSIEGLNANQRRVQSRPITGIGQSVDFNRALWHMTAEMAEAA